MSIPKDLCNIIDEVIYYVNGTSNDWFRIKMEIINAFPPKERSRFSRRHESTKKQILNEFDFEVIKYWEKCTGETLFIDENKLHPKDWVLNPKGWGLQRYNDERKRQKTA